MASGGPAVPLTGLQSELLAELAKGRSDEGYLAGGAALHFAPNSPKSCPKPCGLVPRLESKFSETGEGHTRFQRTTLMHSPNARSLFSSR
jgi:hypothetical protein